MACFREVTRPDGFFVVIISTASKMQEGTLHYRTTFSFHILSYSFLAVIQEFKPQVFCF
jgi:hypothetical protein